MFLLPVLERVGFAKWSEERGTEEPQPEVLAAEIFHLLLTRLGVTDEDPIWGFAAAFRPFDGLRAVPSSVEGRLKPEGCESAANWLRACRRFRHAPDRP